MPTHTRFDDAEFTDDDDDEYIPSGYDNVEDELNIIELERENPEMYQTFIQVREYLMSEMPTINQLMVDELDLKDRAHLVELYEIYVSLEPLTQEWVQIGRAA